MTLETFATRNDLVGENASKGQLTDKVRGTRIFGITGKGRMKRQLHPYYCYAGMPKRFAKSPMRLQYGVR